VLTDETADVITMNLDSTIDSNIMSTVLSGEGKDWARGGVDGNAKKEILIMNKSIEEKKAAAVPNTKESVVVDSEVKVDSSTIGNGPTAGKQSQVTVVDNDSKKNITPVSVGAIQPRVDSVGHNADLNVAKNKRDADLVKNEPEKNAWKSQPSQSQGTAVDNNNAMNSVIPASVAANQPRIDAVGNIVHLGAVKNKPDMAVKNKPDMDLVKNEPVNNAAKNQPRIDELKSESVVKGISRAPSVILVKSLEQNDEQKDQRNSTSQNSPEGTKKIGEEKKSADADADTIKTADRSANIATTGDVRGDIKGDPRGDTREDPRGDPREISRGNSRADSRKNSRGNSTADSRGDSIEDRREYLRGHTTSSRAKVWDSLSPLGATKTKVFNNSVGTINSRAIGALATSKNKDAAGATKSQRDLSPGSKARPARRAASTSRLHGNETGGKPKENGSSRLVRASSRGNLTPVETDKLMKKTTTDNAQRASVKKG